MDIEKLIEEQKKTQEAIKLLRESDNYEELLKSIPEVELKYDEKMFFDGDPWDYEGLSYECDMTATQCIKKAVESFGKAKYYLEYVKRFYEGQIKQWEDYREYCKTLPKRQRGYWKTRYKNPVCLKFFDDYEKAHGIKNSIYQEVKNES